MPIHKLPSSVAVSTTTRTSHLLHFRLPVFLSNCCLSLQRVPGIPRVHWAPPSLYKAHKFRTRQYPWMTDHGSTYWKINGQSRTLSLSLVNNNSSNINTLGHFTQRGRATPGPRSPRRTMSRRRKMKGSSVVVVVGVHGFTFNLIFQMPTRGIFFGPLKWSD